MSIKLQTVALARLHLRYQYLTASVFQRMTHIDISHDQTHYGSLNST